MPDNEAPRARIAKSLRVVRESPGAAARLYIDGELFEYATVDGFSVHPKRGQIPSVSVQIAAQTVEVDDCVQPPAEES